MDTPTTAGECGTGGSGPIPTTTLQAFEVGVDSSTDPNGFDITLPTAMDDATYIPEVMIQPPTIADFTNVFVLSRTATTLRLAALDNFADGTILFIIVAKKTN
jgi:hypothetical protein